MLSASVAALAATASGCDSRQSTLAPHSHAAREISTLWWVMLVGSAIVFAVVVALILIGTLRRRGRAPGDRGRLSPGRRFVTIGGLIVPAVTLVALFALMLRALPATSAAPTESRLRIDVIGRQWFWDVRYPATGLRSANEIHLPVGVPVDIRVTSRDVIHSLWVPALNRKIDVIPGRTNDVLFEATRAGTYRGQCAEFCGLQHANMAFWVVAQPRAEFDSWLARESNPPPPSSSVELERGQQIFLGSACTYCHTIAGTNASGTIGPDLTHFGSRLAIGAGTIPNTRGYLAGWILDPQHIKPGTEMPGTSLTGAQLQALLDYLESLK